MNDIIAQAAEIIAKYNPKLAQAWMDQPFRRVDLSRAFAAGFKCNEYGDAPEIVHLVMRIAYADRESRAVLS